MQTKQELENLISDFSEKAVYELNTLYPGFEKYYNTRLNNKKQNSVTSIMNYIAAHIKSMCVCSVLIYKMCKVYMSVIIFIRVAVSN